MGNDVFGTQRGEVQTEAQRERERIAREAREAQERIAREAKEAQERIRQQQSDIEQQAEAAKARAREAERLEQRKRDLPFTRPTPLGTAGIIADIERQRAEAHISGGKAREDIEKGKEKDVADIEKQKTEAEADIGKWEAESLAKIEKAEADYREAVRQAEREQAKAQADYDEARPEFEAKNIEVAPDVWYDKEFWDSLTKEQQDEVKKTGTYTIVVPPENAVEIKPGVWVDKDEWAGLSPSQKDEVRQTGKYTIEGEPVTIAASGFVTMETPLMPPEPPKSIWAKIGSTIIGYLKNQFISPDIPSQADLKAQYEAEENAPLWSRLLFGVTVIKDPKTGEYYPVIMTEAPMISLAGSGVKVAGVAVKTIEINWNKFVSAKVIKPAIDWNKLVKAVELGEVRDAAQATKWAAAQARWKAAVTVTKVPMTEAQVALQIARNEEGMRLAAVAAARARAVSSVSIGKVVLVPQPNVSVTQWKPFLPSQLTVSRMKALIIRLQAMAPVIAVEQIMVAGLLTVAIATNPAAISKMLSQVPSKVRADALSRVTPAIAHALETKALAQAQALAQVQTQTQLQLQTLMKQATALATKLQLQNKTATQIQEAVQTQLQQQVKTITNTQVRTQAQQSVKTIAQTVTQTVTRTITPTKPTPAQKVPTPKMPKLITLPVVTLPDGSSHTMTPKELAGSVAWKQGFIFKMIFPPYGKNNIVNTREPIPGVPVLTGARSAYESIIRKGGKVPKTLGRDMGIMDIIISTPKLGRPKMIFRRDIFQRTRLTGRRHKPVKRHGTSEPTLGTIRG